ncbi:uncharacterized protein LOC126981508 [Eriocheir sinensis]|uniref:uncharacterized protein LOC126981508 n=1 Tax=Eriocheir sinensis TaxID=95602 RepID=UPI0021CA1D8C|nr:uncharacterized protein LOC126981508 [Eriocheir sinensis]
MHFWIDKRSACGQRGAQFVGSPCLYRPKARHYPMVTPVHRFQRIESLQVEGRRAGEAGRSRGGRGRRQGSSRPSTDEDEEESVRVPLGETPPPEETCLTRLGVAANRPPRRTSANSSVYSRVPDNFNLFRMGGINWCVWAAFILVTMLLVPAHLYLKNFHYRGELVGIIFVVILLFLVCFSVSLFHTKTRAILLHRLNLEDDARGCALDQDAVSPGRRRPLFPTPTLTHRRLVRHLPCPPVRMSMSTPDLVDGHALARDRMARSHSQAARGVSYGLLRPHEAGEHRLETSLAFDAASDPPPYHVAILLPAPTHAATRECETPPPAYDVVQ